MRITSQSPTELVVKDSSLGISAICAGTAVALMFFRLAKAQPNMFLVAALYLLFAFLADCRTTFTFDAIQQVVRWRGRKFFRNQSGTIPFSDITDITVEALSSHSGGVTHRLAILTVNGSTPMSFTYSGIGNFEQTRAAILAFLHPGMECQTRQHFDAAALESSIRSLLLQGRKIDAVTLLRTREQIGLTEAVKRINAVDLKLKAESPR